MTKTAILHIVSLVTIISFSGCNILRTPDQVHIGTVKRNVCKELKGDVVIFAIFVESKHTGYWSDFDISSTLDSIRKAARWLEDEAADRDIYLKITVDYPKDKDGLIPIEQRLQYKNLINTLFPPPRGSLEKGIILLDRWADKSAKSIGRYYPDLIPDSARNMNKRSDREQLIAYIRNEHQTDNVAMLYFLNRYYSDELSLCLHAHEDDKIEYSIITEKVPGVIIHEFLHLFGAWDLYLSPFEKQRRKARKRKEMIMNKFPNEVMAFPFRRVEKLEINEITEYLIGWRPSLTQEVEDMITNKKFKVVKY